MKQIKENKINILFIILSITLCVLWTTKRESVLWLIGILTTKQVLNIVKYILFFVFTVLAHIVFCLFVYCIGEDTHETYKLTKLLGEKECAKVVDIKLLRIILLLSFLPFLCFFISPFSSSIEILDKGIILVIVFLNGIALFNILGQVIKRKIETKRKELTQ